MSVKRTLTKENAVILGVFDHLYALNAALWESFDEEYNRLIVERKGSKPSHHTVENNIRKKTRALFEDFLKTYSYIFIDSEKPLHTTAKSLEYFTLFEPDKKSKDIFYKMKTFQRFLYDVEDVADRIVFERNHKNRIFCTGEDVAQQVSNRILSLVEQRKAEIILDSASTLTLTDNPLYIFENLRSTSCFRHEHPITTEPFYAEKADGSGIVLLPTLYCDVCRKYMIGRVTLSVFDKSFGKTMLERRKEESEDQPFNGFRVESELHQLGYNVIDGELTDDERHNILSYILTHNKLEYKTVVASIEQNVRIFEGIPKYQLAVQKWKEDLKFIGKSRIKSE